MAGTGPAPKAPDQRARRNATVAMTRLPAEGRQGRTPRWPLVDDIGSTVTLRMLKSNIKELRLLVDDPDLTPRRRAKLDQDLAKVVREAAVLDAQIKQQRRLERSLWTQLWKTPQAVEWERLRWDREVAQYVRWKVRAEQGNLNASVESRQLADRLGLNPMSLLRLRWEIAADEVGERRDDRAAARQRGRYAGLRVVGTAAGSDA